MSKRIAAPVAGMLIFLVAGLALAEGASHRVEKGDTLWDLSQKYWDNSGLWPEMWSLNPQLKNPHWIYPGEVIYLDRSAATQAEKRVIRLPLQRLAPGREGLEDGAAAAASAEDQQGSAPTVRLTRRETQDFVSSHQLQRVGVLSNRHQKKVVYGTGEDVEFDSVGGAGLEVGTLLTLFDDSQVVKHPVTAQPEGYFVKIYGHLEVLGVVGDRAVGRVIEAYDGIEDGCGLMPYRKPFDQLQLKESSVGVEGVILCGRPEASVFANDDIVYLDKGTLHGLEPGVVLEVPVREGERSAQGLVDLGLPLATLVVVTAEEKSAASLIVSSRAAIEQGDRFIAAPFSP